MRFGGNDLACQSCHLNAGLQPFAAPFVSTFASFPMMVSDRVLTLKERINGCMTRSMNGKPLPDNGREMQALIAYVKFVGTGSPEGVRVPGMGLKPLPEPAEQPDTARGEAVYAEFCANCHKADGQGEKRLKPAIGYTSPPLWGRRQLQCRRRNGQARLRCRLYPRQHALRHRLPGSGSERAAAWDVAAYVRSMPRPPALPTASALQ
jgi:thiosulfate dehydrogenase